MSAIYSELAERIRGEVSDLDRIVKRVLSYWNRGEKSPHEQDVYLDSVALNLHSFYSGVERLFELIARHVDRDLPDGKHWHRDLLEQMTKDIEDTRPAVISRTSGDDPDEFRRFRHMVRNVYTFNLVPDKMQPLITRLDSRWSRIRDELLAFATFIDDVARTSEP